MKKTNIHIAIILVSVVSQIIIITASFAQDDKIYRDPPELIKSPVIAHEYSAETREFTGISSMAVSPGGRLWATWYAGITPGEDKNNYVVVATSGDKGDTWEEVLVMDPIHDQVRAYDPHA